jgi:hypothetical protein
MDTIHLLHNAARHYCIEQSARWTRRYMELNTAGRGLIKASNGGRIYTDEAYDTFPRYKVLDAIRADVERFVPGDFQSLEELRETLRIAGLTAIGDLTEPDNGIEANAVEEERNRFVAFVNDPDLERFAGLPELPFRRVLGKDEHRSLHHAFCHRWGRWYGGVHSADASAEIVTLHTQAIENPGAYDRLRAVLVEHGIMRVLELREWGEGYELDVADVEFTYTGAEGFWTSGDMAWMVYASHEASITFGGTWLIERMREAVPKWDLYLYRGWDLAAYRAP